MTSINPLADPADTAPNNRNEIHDYFCNCTQLLLGSSTALEDLVKRSLDNATILPLPENPVTLSTRKEKPHVAMLFEEDLNMYLFDLPNRETIIKTGQGSIQSINDLSSPFIVKFEDGFEKRFLLRCPKCEIPWAYMLEEAATSTNSSKKSAREDVLYILEAAVKENSSFS